MYICIVRFVPKLLMYNPELTMYLYAIDTISISELKATNVASMYVESCKRHKHIHTLTNGMNLTHT